MSKPDSRGALPPQFQALVTVAYPYNYAISFSLARASGDTECKSYTALYPLMYDIFLGPLFFNLWSKQVLIYAIVSKK